MKKRISLVIALFVVTSAFVGGLLKPGIAQAGGGVVVNLTTSAASVSYNNSPRITATVPYNESMRISNNYAQRILVIARVTANNLPDNSGVRNFWYTTCTANNSCSFSITPQFYSTDANKTARFVAYAVDNIYQVMSYSNTLDISVLPVATDTVAPVVSLNVNKLNVYNGESLRITANASDVGGSGVANITIYERNNVTSVQTAKLNCSNRNDCVYTYNVPNITDSYSYTYYAVARDNVGNVGTSASQDIYFIPAPTNSRVLNLTASRSLVNYNGTRFDPLTLTLSVKGLSGSGNITVKRINADGSYDSTAGVNSWAFSCGGNRECTYAMSPTFSASDVGKFIRFEAVSDDRFYGNGIFYAFTIVQVASGTVVDAPISSDSVVPTIGFSAYPTVVGYDGINFYPSSLTASVTDNVGLDRIVINRVNADGVPYTNGVNSWTLYCNNSRECSRTVSPIYSASDLGAGDLVGVWFKATAYDTAGNHIDSKMISVVIVKTQNTMPVPTPVDTVAPTVTLTSSRDVVNYNGISFDPLSLTLSANDNVGLDSQVGIQMSDAYGNAITPSVSWTAVPSCYNRTSCQYTATPVLNTSMNGSNIYFYAYARDLSGHVAKSAVKTIRINNTSVTSDITAPSISLYASNSQVASNQNFSLTADSNDNQSGIKIVRIYEINAGGSTNVIKECRVPFCVISMTALNTSVNNVTHNYFAQAIDNAGNSRSSSNVAVTFLGNNTDTTAPTLTLNTSRAVVNYNGTSFDPLTIIASATDSVGLSQIVFNRVNSNGTLDTAGGNTWSFSCGSNSRYECNKYIYPTFSVNDIGKTIYYRATAYDTAGNHTDRTTSVVVYQTPTPTPTPTGALTVTNSITPGVSNGNISIAANPKATGRATSKNGVWGIETRMTTSWSTAVVKNRCIFTGNPTDGQCVLDVGNSIKDHVGGTVKIWSIAWDAKTGMGADSAVTSLTVVR